jgi:putative colanic acid biosynthesis acetyltransferase WcaB
LLATLQKLFLEFCIPSKQPQKIMHVFFQDWQANDKNPKGRLVLLLFRIAHWSRTTNMLTYALGFPYLVFYRLIVEWVLGIELPQKTKIGPGLQLHHGFALVVNDNTVIGSDCILRHSTTLGHKSKTSKEPSCPIIGSNVDIGSGVTILGPVTIGDGSIIGAGSVVTKDVPPGSTVVGNPARILSPRSPC